MSSSDWVTSFKDSVKERLLNPFLCAFVVSWCIANYEIPLTFLGDGDYQRKIFYISTVLIRSPGQAFFQMLLVPMAGVLIYLTVIPLLTLATMRLQAIAANQYSRTSAFIRGQALVPQDELAVWHGKYQAEANHLRSTRDDAVSQLAKANSMMGVSLLHYESRWKETLLAYLGSSNFTWNNATPVTGPPVETRAENLCDQLDLPQSWINWIKHKDPKAAFEFNEVSGQFKDEDEARFALDVLVAFGFVKVSFPADRTVYEINQGNLSRLERRKRAPQA